MVVLLAVAFIFTRQADQHDVRCGAFCTYACLRALNLPVASYDDFQKRLGPPSSEGYSMAQLSDAASHFGAKTLGVQTSLANLQRRPGRFACIVRLPPAHFVILSEIAGDKAVIVDPPRDFSLPQATFASRWDGAALLISDERLIPEEEMEMNGWPMIFSVAFGILVTSLVLGAVLWTRKCDWPFRFRSGRG